MDAKLLSKKQSSSELGEVVVALKAVNVEDRKRKAIDMEQSSHEPKAGRFSLDNSSVSASFSPSPARPVHSRLRVLDSWEIFPLR